MKRTEYRKALQKIRKAFDATADRIIDNGPPAVTNGGQSFCTCKDAQGHPKMLYNTLKEAEDQLVYLKEKRLRIYPCPSEKGWHLTKE